MMNNICGVTRLAARIMWRIEREGSGLTEGCLVPVDELQNHIDDFESEEKTGLMEDVQTFMDYWPGQNKQYSVHYVSHIFGVVSLNCGVQNYCLSQV